MLERLDEKFEYPAHNHLFLRFLSTNSWGSKFFISKSDRSSEMKLFSYFFERETNILLELCSLFGAVVLCKVTHFILKYTILNPIPTWDYPLLQRDNFKVLQEALNNGKLPKIFRPKLAPGSTFRKEFLQLCVQYYFVMIIYH